MKRIIKRMAIPTLCCILTLTLFRVFFFLGYVPSSSMEPTIAKGSIIIGDRTAYWAKEPSTGDVILFHRGDKILVKRIAAVSGDCIAHNGKTMVVPDDCCYVLGDNANASQDSRLWLNPFMHQDDIIAQWIGG